MESAEGKGAKQVKATWNLGQFVTIYGNGNPANVNPPVVPYPQVVTGSGSTQTWSQSSSYSSAGKTGGIAPGLNINLNGNGPTAIGFVCSISPNTAITDIEALIATVNIDTTTTWSGTAMITLQGAFDRFSGQTNYSAKNWINIASGTLTTPGASPLQLSVIPSGNATANQQPQFFNAFRIIASGTTTATSGILNWSIPGCFVDISAMAPTFQSPLATQPGLGQMNLTDPRIVTITSGVVTYTNPGIDSIPYSNVSSQTNYIGPE